LVTRGQVASIVARHSSPARLGVQRLDLVQVLDKVSSVGFLQPLNHGVVVHDRVIDDEIALGAPTHL